MLNSSFNEFCLGDLIFEQKERAGDNPESLSVYGVDRKVGITIETKYKSDKTSKYKILRNGMFAYNPMRLNIGSIGYCHDALKAGLVSPDYVVFGCNEDKLDPEYLYYFIKSEYWKTWVESAGVGSVRVRIYFREIITMPIQVPSLEKQKEIVSMLKSLDNKIELNRQTNQTLEDIAQAIFKSWFVDFEPTRAKMTAKETGQDPELAAMGAISGKPVTELDQLTSEKYQELKTTAALFPDSLVDSELGEIPEGWEVKLNGEVMDVRDGTHDSPKQSESGFPLVTSKHITSGVLDIKSAYLISKEDYESVNKRSKVNQGDILLTMIGTVGVSYLVMQPNVNFAIKNVALFRTSEHKELKNYFYFLLKTPLMQEYLDARMAGTTQKYLSLKTLRSIDMLMPTVALLDAFNVITNPLMDKVFTALEENETLSGFRDSLLPKLLSGEINPNSINQ